MWKSAVCAKDCPDTCGLRALVEDKRIVKVEGDPDHPVTRGFICKKARFYPSHVHSPKRITTPLKRTGAKGTASFARISWDDALDEVSQRINEVCDAYGGEAVLPYSYGGHMGLIQRNSGHAFFNKIGASRLLYTLCGPAATAGFQASLGTGPSTEISSAVDSDYIIIWGSNTLVTNIHAWPVFSEARKKGAFLVVIDPYRTPTAKKADLHLMIRPGTDAALALSIMNVLISENLINTDYIAEKTLGFDDLRQRASEYPPERSAEICGIDEQLIRTLARGYGKAQAPYIRTGWGPARQLRGGMAMRTIALLPALVGAFDKRGGGITRSLGGALSDLTCLTRPDFLSPPTRAINMVELGKALTRVDDPPVRLLYNFMANPAAVAPESRMVREGLSRPDLFVVVHELYMTDTAKFADIILPGASFFEVKDLYRSYGHNYIQMAEPVIAPVGETRSTLSIFQSLAARMGFTDEVFSMTEDDFIDAILKVPDPFMDGVDLQGLRAGKAVRLNIPANPYGSGFNTPSGKVEFYSTAMADQGLDPLPSGEPLRDPDGGREYPLECMTPPHPMLLNSAFNEVDAIRDQIGGPVVLIHPTTAALRGILDGAPVRIFNGRGEYFLTARITRNTREEVLVTEGLYRPADSPCTGPNQLTSQRITDMGNTCAFHCNRVEIEPLNLNH